MQGNHGEAGIIVYEVSLGFSRLQPFLPGMEKGSRC